MRRRSSLSHPITALACLIGCFSLSSCSLPLSQPIPLSLTHRAFPDLPGPAAAAWIPPAFDPTAGWSLIVHFHGFHNCVLNAIGNVSSSCTASQPARVAYSLGQQLDASKANALLILPEGNVENDAIDPLLPLCYQRALSKYSTILPPTPPPSV